MAVHLLKSAFTGNNADQTGGAGKQWQSRWQLLNCFYVHNFNLSCLLHRLPSLPSFPFSSMLNGGGRWPKPASRSLHQRLMLAPAYNARGSCDLQNWTVPLFRKCCSGLGYKFPLHQRRPSDHLPLTGFHILPALPEICLPPPVTCHMLGLCQQEPRDKSIV